MAHGMALVQVLKAAVNPGVKRYNVFWQQLESSSVQPSTSPLKCPNGYIQVCCHVHGVPIWCCQVPHLYATEHQALACEQLAASTRASQTGTSSS